jgi:hypothetical protein
MTILRSASGARPKGVISDESALNAQPSRDPTVAEARKTGRNLNRTA